MILLRLVTALLCIVLGVLVFSLFVVVFSPRAGLGGSERAFSAAIMLALATPLALQLRTLVKRTREMTANHITFDDSGVSVRLDGSYRASKGLPAIPETHVPWSEITAIVRERQTFIYPALIPFEYPLTVYVIVADQRIPFTNECLPRARHIAAKLEDRLRMMR